MKTCKDCAYCDKNLCRVDPPKLGFEKLGDASATLQQGTWPEIDPEKDWCGKFKSKTKARATVI